MTDSASPIAFTQRSRISGQHCLSPQIHGCQWRLTECTSGRINASMDGEGRGRGRGLAVEGPVPLQCCQMEVFMGLPDP